MGDADEQRHQPPQQRECRCGAPAMCVGKKVHRTIHCLQFAMASYYRTGDKEPYDLNQISQNRAKNLGSAAFQLFCQSKTSHIAAIVASNPGASLAA